MPPWFADPKVGVFSNDPSLAADAIATIAKWVDGGAPQGDLKDMPKAPQFVEGWQLGEPDMIVELPEILIPATGGDYFPTPNLALPLTEDRWIRAVEIRPGNREVTLHSVMFSANVGAAMNAGSGAINPSGVFDVLAASLAGNINFTIPPQACNDEMRAAYVADQTSTSSHSSRTCTCAAPTWR